MKVTASDADDPTYGSSARVVYSVLDGEKFFIVDKHTGKKTLSETAIYFLYSEDLLVSPALSVSPQVIYSSERTAPKISQNLWTEILNQLAKHKHSHSQDSMLCPFV